MVRSKPGRHAGKLESPDPSDKSVKLWTGAISANVNCHNCSIPTSTYAYAVGTDSRNKVKPYCGLQYTDTTPKQHKAKEELQRKCMSNMVSVIFSTLRLMIGAKD